MPGGITKAPTLALTDQSAAKDVLCPLCAQSLPCADFLHTKDFSIMIRSSHVAQLSPNEANIFRMMLENRAEGISQSALVTRVYASDGGPAMASECVYMAIANIKRKLKPLKITIQSVKRLYRPQFHA